MRLERWQAARGRILRVGVLLALLAVISGCYNGVDAVSYANKYALSPNGQYVTQNEDCTDFVSQAVKAGGASFVNFPGDATGSKVWFGIKKNDRADMVAQSIWMYINGNHDQASGTNGRDSVAWVNVPTFLYAFRNTTASNGYPRATLVGEYSYEDEYFMIPSIKAPPTPGGMYPGDVYGYVWNGDLQSEISHLSIQVAGSPGVPVADPNHTGWNGDLVDSHTNARKQVFWSLKPVSPSWKTTTIFFFHLNGSD